MKKVLFVCVHNSARSQMAEVFLNFLGNHEYIAQSAGLEPGVLNPLVVNVMQEDRIDISQNSTDSVFDFYKEGRRYNYVITVCNETSAQRCPIFPGNTVRIHWSFDDPSSFEGTYEEKLHCIRKVKFQIKDKVEQFINYEREGKIPMDWIAQ